MAVSEWYSQFSQSPEELSDDQVETMTRLYRAAIEYVDDQVGRLVDHLRRTDRFEETLVLVTSDHGELFGEHGQYGKPDVLYNELLRVPLIAVNGHDRLAAARDELHSLLDLPPLIHDALGLPRDEAYEGQIPGRSPPREHVMAEMEVDGDVIVGARSRDWLYEGDEITDEHRVSDLRDGGRTRVSLSGDLPAPVVPLQRAVLDRLEAFDVDPHRLEAEVEGEMRDRLEDLGYL
jgi:arylsulfatase A-like enzyme